MQSTLFPETKTDYTFTAQWLISPSKEGKAPMNGDKKLAEQEVTFTSGERELPSLKITGDARVLTSVSTLQLEIKTKNIDASYGLSAALLCKSDDGTAYVETGWNQTEDVKDSLSVPLHGQKPGSFCLMLTVMQSDTNTVVMEVPYYFVIKPVE